MRPIRPRYLIEGAARTLVASATPLEFTVLVLV